ncbi:MAG TPA: hypothetical protein VEV82_09855 [Actinomycetota bacterium]|nr:hypothetical protein [Actinomycetota bacterium]
MQQASGLDFFTKARVWAGSIVLLAGLCAIVGSAVDWVTVTPPPKPPPGVDFEDRPFGSDDSSDSFSGLEVRDGWVTLISGAALMTGGMLLIMRRRGGWLAVFASIPIGAVTLSAYRAIDSPTSGLLERTETVGDVDPGLGLTLLAGAALVGLIAGVIGLAATPNEETDA